MGAVVGFVIGIANALDLLAAPWTRLVEAAVHGHLGTKSGDFFREALFGLGAQALNPEGESGTRGSEEAFPLVGLELVGESNG